MFTKSNVAVTGARLVLAFGEFEYLPQCKICAATGGLLLVYVIFMLPIPGHHVTMCKDHFIHKTWNKNNTRVNWYQKGKTSLDLLEQDIVSGSGISWAIYKYAP